MSRSERGVCGRRTCTDPAACGRQGEDRPARCDQPGAEIASRRRVASDPGAGLCPLADVASACRNTAQAWRCERALCLRAPGRAEQASCGSARCRRGHCWQVAATICRTSDRWLAGCAPAGHAADDRQCAMEATIVRTLEACRLAPALEFAHDGSGVGPVGLHGAARLESFRVAAASLARPRDNWLSTASYSTGTSRQRKPLQMTEMMPLRTRGSATR